MSASAAVIVASALAIGYVVKQPVFGSISFAGAVRADAGRLREHVRYLTEDLFPRSVGHPENLDRAAEYIKEQISRAGVRATEQRFRADGGTFRNITARLGRTDGPLLIVGAHYDVYGDLPGADDNASGVAGLLELARMLANVDLDVSLELVAFSAEEPPHFGSDRMGSAVHARSLRNGDRVPIGMIGLEMIGFFSESQPAPNRLLRWFYPETGDFIVVVGRWTDRALVRHMKRTMRGVARVPVHSYTGPRILGTDLSDHRNYWIYGFKAVMVTDTGFIRNPNYHTAADTADTLDYGRMAAVVDGVANAILNADALD